jgi:hypothetical protein
MIFVRNFGRNGASEDLEKGRRRRKESKKPKTNRKEALNKKKDFQ